MIVSDRSTYAFLLILLLILTVLFWVLATTLPNEMEPILILDAISCLNIGLPAFYLMIALVFVRGYKRFPKWMLCFLITPVLMPLICLTNNLHHLQYVVFSPIRSQIVFGPFVLVTGVHSYLCYLASLVLLVSFAWRNPSRLYIFQCLLLVLGGLFPLIVSVASTLSLLALPVTAPLLISLPTLLLNGIAIYRFNLLNIIPVATQHILDGISDCYMVVSEQGLVVSYNRPFADVFPAQYGITEKRSLRYCLQEEDNLNRRLSITWSTLWTPAAPPKLPSPTSKPPRFPEAMPHERITTLSTYPRWLSMIDWLASFSSSMTSLSSGNA